MIDSTISHYKILKKLGEGGMGVVYKAQDTKLDRIVALKFLPEHLLCDEEAKRRFVHEAKAASALNHPNITTIHETDEVKGECFISMEYIEGKSIKELIKEKEFTLDEILRIAIQIAEGLNAAHKKGIVHRDIKSDNIMVTDQGLVKIMDFGLAKLKGVTKLTKTGSTLGTLQYMSPEQAQEMEVDQRSDIFSFGVVLYEMIAGQLPFKGEHEAAVIYSIVNETPEPLARYKANVPDELQRILDKALRKDLSTRYQSAAEIMADLKELQKETTTGVLMAPQKKRISTRTIVFIGVAVLIVMAGYAFLPRFLTPVEKEPVTQRKMLAVLPFENLGAPEDEYFADGITDEITSRLAKLSGLGVISRTSSIRYKDTDKSLSQIAEELGVSFILEGTIRWDKSGDTDRVRITPQLIKVSDNTHLWAENYGRDMSDIFAVQADIATQIASALDVTLQQPEREALEGRPTENLDAYHAYLRGQERLWAFDLSAENLNLAVMTLERATELDPDFALAYAALSEARSFIYNQGYDRTEEHLAKAKEALDRALILQPKLPEAHHAYGYYHYAGYRNYEKALQQYAIAQKSLPDDYRLMARIGWVLRRQGKFEEAIEYLKKASELNPRDPFLLNEIGVSLIYLRDYPAAERYYDRCISLAPDQPVGYFSKAILYWAWNGDLRAARAVLENAPERVGYSRWQWWVLYFQEFLERDYRGALNLLATVPFDMIKIAEYSYPKVLLEADCYWMMDKVKLAHVAYDSARTLLEASVKEMPDDFRYRSALGWAYAGLDRKDEAIREGKLAVELMPVSKDALNSLDILEALGRIYIMVGEYEAALDVIDYQLSIPGWVSVSLFRIDPRYDPLRDNPRFQKLLEKYE
jgi:serine/threonine protein kinase/Flp pilus assembly protein TadD